MVNKKFAYQRSCHVVVMLMSIERLRDYRWICDEHLLDLDSGELDVPLNLETGDVVRVNAVSEGGEALAIDVDLQKIPQI